MNIVNEKQQVRDRFLSIRKHISPSQKALYDKKIYEKLLTIKEFISPSIISSYISLPSEVDTKTMLANEFESGKRTIVAPKITGKTLSFLHIQSFDDCISGAFGILEPKNTCPIIPTDRIQCFIIPGVAFDTKGMRLGYGRGYYDSVLQNTHAYTIALSYECQISQTVLPHDDHDMSVHMIITERNIYTLTENKCISDVY